MHLRRETTARASSARSTLCTRREGDDGDAPSENIGIDSAHDGSGQIREPRMYQLIIRQRGQIRDRTFEIEFLDPSAEVVDFTFG